MNKADFNITIVDRGEGIVYRGPDGEYHFDIFLGAQPYTIYADHYWDGQMPIQAHQLTEDEKTIILPRLISHLKEQEPGATVVIKWKDDPVPLKTSRDIEKQRALRNNN